MTVVRVELQGGPADGRATWVTIPDGYEVPEGERAPGRLITRCGGTYFVQTRDGRAEYGRHISPAAVQALLLEEMLCDLSPLSTPGALPFGSEGSPPGVDGGREEAA